MEKYPNGTTMPNLATQITMFRTPNMDRGDLTPENLKRRAEKGLPLDLNKQLQTLLPEMLGTPTAQDSSAALTDRGKCNMGEQVNGLGLKLQPAFVEWMMGLPMNWTSLEQETIEPTD